MMWGMEIGKRQADKRMWNTADLRKAIRFRYIHIGMASTLYCWKASIIKHRCSNDMYALPLCSRPGNNSCCYNKR